MCNRCAVMSCGTPVVISDIGALSESVDHGVSGLVFPANDAEALSQCIVGLILDDSLRIRMGEKARQKALTDFDWQLVVDKFSRFCSTLQKQE